MGSLGNSCSWRLLGEANTIEMRIREATEMSFSILMLYQPRNSNYNQDFRIYLQACICIYVPRPAFESYVITFPFYTLFCDHIASSNSACSKMEFLLPFHFLHNWVEAQPIHLWKTPLRIHTWSWKTFTWLHTLVSAMFTCYCSS